MTGCVSSAATSIKKAGTEERKLGETELLFR